MDGLGLEAVGQRVEPGRAVLACRVLEPDDWCRRRGCQGRRGQATRYDNYGVTYLDGGVLAAIVLTHRPAVRRRP